MTVDQLDEALLAALKAGKGSRQDLMAIESIRVRTWATVSAHLKTLAKQRQVIETKAGWRLA